jgi:large subunit ribosomal protein L4
MKATPLTVSAVGDRIPGLITNGKYTQALHETVVAYRANRRAGTHSTKTKATVNFSGKKPWRQKGTGNARAGYKSSPIWRKGGVVFGPLPRDYSKTTSKKIKHLALKKALSTRIVAGEVHLVDTLALATAKTKDLLNALFASNIIGGTLIISEALDKNLILAAQNVPDIEVVTGDNVNAEQLLRYENVVLTEAALSKITARFADKE